MTAMSSVPDVGDEIPVFERVVGFPTWNRYAAVNDEFVAIHMDDDAGRAAGYPSAFGMGNLHVAYLHCMLRDWLGGRGRIAGVRVQFRNPALRDTRNRARGVVTAVDLDAVTGASLVVLDVWVEDGDGQQLTRGTADVIVDGPDHG